MIHLGYINIDLALKEPHPTELTEESIPKQWKEMAQWECSNYLSLIIMKSVILEAFLGTMTKEISAVKFLKQLEQRFVKSDMAEVITLLHKLVFMRYNGSRNYENTFLRCLVQYQLRALHLELVDEVTVYFALMSLSPQFNSFEVSYNYQDKKMDS